MKLIGLLSSAVRHQDQTIFRDPHCDRLAPLKWDAAGQLLKEQTLARGKSVVLQHQYDELGNRTVMALPDGREIRHFYYGC